MPSSRRIVLLVGVVLAGIYAWRAQQLPPRDIPPAGNAPVALEDNAPVLLETVQGPADRAFNARRSGEMMALAGTVARVLPDDRDGSAHQRFIVRLPSGLTVLVAHNIDLAPRVSGVTAGDPIALRGQYEWNEQGGVIHWTHHDPQGAHEPGWIEHRGRRYQ